MPFLTKSNEWLTPGDPADVYIDVPIVIGIEIAVSRLGHTLSRSFHSLLKTPGAIQ